MLSRARGRAEWRDVFVRELTMRRSDREDYRAARIADAIESRFAVRLAANSLDDSQPQQFVARDFPVVKHGRTVSIDLNEKGVWQKPEGLYTRLRMPSAWW